MKYKIISALLISALLFSASCSNNENENSEDNSIDYNTDISENTETESIPESITLTETRKKLIEENMTYDADNFNAQDYVREYLPLIIPNVKINDIGYSYGFVHSFSNNYDLFYKIYDIDTESNEKNQISILGIQNDSSVWISDIFLTNEENDVNHVKLDNIVERLNHDPRFANQFELPVSEIDEQIKSLNLTQLTSDTLTKCGDFPIILDCYDVQYNSDGSIIVTYTGKTNKYIFTIDVESEKILSFDTIPKSEFELLHNKYTNGSYTVIIDDSETSSDGDMYVKNEATGEKVLVDSAVNDFDMVNGKYPALNDYYNFDVYKFEGNRLYYIIYGYEWTRGLGVYDCETGEHHVYEIYRIIIAVDGNTVYAINDIGDIDSTMSLYEIKLNADGCTETKLSDPDGIIPTDYFADCDVSPQLGTMVMIDSGCLKKIDISDGSLKLINSLSFIPSLCSVLNTKIFDNHLVILCEGNASCDDYIYIYDLK